MLRISTLTLNLALELGLETREPVHERKHFHSNGSNLRGLESFAGTKVDDAFLSRAAISGFQQENVPEAKQLIPESDAGVHCSHWSRRPIGSLVLWPESLTRRFSAGPYRLCRSWSDTRWSPHISASAETGPEAGDRIGSVVKVEERAP